MQNYVFLGKFLSVRVCDVVKGKRTVLTSESMEGSTEKGTKKGIPLNPNLLLTLNLIP